jgi:D-cysteine desulfhydrase/L-cysteate sulfo-lyase
VLPRLVPDRDPAYDTSGNLLLDEWLGARVRIVAQGADVAPAVAEIEARAAARGGKAFFIGPGGSTPTGSVGYARAALELADQLSAGAPRPDAIVLAVSSGGTLAGLLVGLEALGLDVPVIAVSVYGPGAKVALVVRGLADATCALLGTPRVADTRLDLRDEALGPGYGLPTPEVREALALAARSEGLLLDPVYTGKAMAGLISLIRKGNLPGRRVLFWHTGGAPGLFAYPELVAKKSDDAHGRPIAAAR